MPSISGPKEANRVWAIPKGHRCRGLGLYAGAHVTAPEKEGHPRWIPFTPHAPRAAANAPPLAPVFRRPKPLPVARHVLWGMAWAGVIYLYLSIVAVFFCWDGGRGGTLDSLLFRGRPCCHATLGAPPPYSGRCPVRRRTRASDAAGAREAGGYGANRS